MKQRQHACNPSKHAASEATPERRFINEHQLSDLTGVAVGTWQKKRLLGGGPRYYKLGGAVRYDMGEVLRWIEAGARGEATA